MISHRQWRCSLFITICSSRSPPFPLLGLELTFLSPPFIYICSTTLRLILSVFTGHLWSLLSLFTSQNQGKIYFQSWKQKTKDFGMFSHGKATVDWNTMLSTVFLSLISASFYLGGKFYPGEKYPILLKTNSTEILCQLRFLYFLHQQ